MVAQLIVSNITLINTVQPLHDIYYLAPSCNGKTCGPHSQLQADCSCSKCLLNTVGQPPNCKPQCIVNSDCLSHQSCHENKCIDPCIDACGENTDCKTIRNKPVCSCKTGAKGDPYVKCTIDQVVPDNECSDGTQCGTYGRCDQEDRCQCLPGFVGQPPLCQPGCIRNTDCPKNQGCISDKCQDPCIAACGLKAICQVVDHVPRCYCEANHVGDPYEQCIPSEPAKPEDDNPCQSCGSNTKCNENQCQCIEGYKGDPLVGCRPECILNTECQPSQACINKKCVDPCSNTCGSNAKCSVVNHFTICSCEPGYSGNPFKHCTKTITCT